MRHHTVPILAAGLLLSGGALAAPPAGGHTPALQSCPGLFGDQALRARNAARRQQQIDWIDEDESGVTIAHTSSGWGEEPFRLSIRGVQLVSTRGGAAVFQLSEEAAAKGRCRPARYRVGADSALSRHTRVLAVLSHVVLVEHRGKLAFIAPAMAPVPRWLLAWRMEGEVPAGGPASQSYSSSVVY